MSEQERTITTIGEDNHGAHSVEVGIRYHGGVYLKTLRLSFGDSTDLNALGAKAQEAVRVAMLAATAPLAPVRDIKENAS
ncbi:MAG: hypothetical protein ACYDCC_04675 [Actinomycetota bacterium]